MSSQLNPQQLNKLAAQIKRWSRDLGFQHAGITDTDLSGAERKLSDWLDRGYHGEMDWMARHGSLRSRPAELLPGTQRIISVRMDYLPKESSDAKSVLHNDQLGYISRYALGRDYHKIMRRRLQKLAELIREAVGPFDYRAFVDSAPVLEKPLAQKAGLGWIGKHTNVLSREAGSWFFLGELYTNLPLPVDQPVSNHCGSCEACITTCPTGAIVSPYCVDARLCISYLTIEHKGSIPPELRSLLGNRIYGCDDCQLVCPWNRFAANTAEAGFLPRHRLDAPRLVELFAWDEKSFLKNMEGSAIRRIGYENWLRNIAVALGNCKTESIVVSSLQNRLNSPSDIVREHVQWALAQHTGKNKE